MAQKRLCVDKVKARQSSTPPSLTDEGYRQGFVFGSCVESKLGLVRAADEPERVHGVLSSGLRLIDRIGTIVFTSASVAKRNRGCELS